VDVRGDGLRKDFPAGSRLEGNMARRADLMIAGQDPGPHPDCLCQRPGWVESDGHSPWECEMHRPALVDPLHICAQIVALRAQLAEVTRERDEANAERQNLAFRLASFKRWMAALARLMGGA